MQEASRRSIDLRMLGEYIGFDLYRFFYIKYKFEVVVGNYFLTTDCGGTYVWWAIRTKPPTSKFASSKYRPI